MSLSKVYKNSEVVFEPKALVEKTMPQEETIPPKAAIETEPQKTEPQTPPPQEEATETETIEPGISQEEVAELTSEARQQGILEGQQQAEKEFHSTVAALRLLCGQLEELRETLLGNSRTELRDLVIAIAEKIIHQSIAEQDHTIVQTIEEALSRALKADAIEIRVNPHDYKILSEKSEELIPGINALSHIVFKADATIARGGCHLEADTCTVDATIANQLDVIRQKLDDHEE